MSAQLLDGRVVAKEIRAALARRVTEFIAANGRRPCLAAVVVGDDEANLAYVRSKARAAEGVGMAFSCIEVPTAAGTDHVVARIEALNGEPHVDAIMVELPLPPGYDPWPIRAAIDPARDVDGVTPDSLSRLILGLPGPRPATAQAVMTILEMAGVELVGRRAVVVGRSATVGKPTAFLLLNAHATVTFAHSRTTELAELTHQADIIVSAAGQPGLIGASHVRPGAVVIDVGTTPVSDGMAVKMVGDVDFAGVVEIAGAITPVPGGVGPVTTSIALRTAVELADVRVASR